MTISALDLATETKNLLTELGVGADRYTGGTLRVTSPVTGKEIGALKEHSASEARTPSRRHTRHSSSGGPSRLRSAANSSACSAKNSARQKPHSVAWSRSRLARSPPRVSAKSRK